MATKTTATAAAVCESAVCESEALRLGGVEALRLKTPGPVRRNLFGPVDHRQLRQDFRTLLAVGVDLATVRWGFDFQSDRPTAAAASSSSSPAANIEWEELRYEEVPVFYRGRTVRTVTAERCSSSPAAGASSAGESSPRSRYSSGSSSGSGDEYLELTTRGRYSVQLAEKRKQATMTDFFTMKKQKHVPAKVSQRLLERDGVTPPQRASPPPHPSLHKPDVNM